MWLSNNGFGDIIHYSPFLSIMDLDHFFYTLSHTLKDSVYKSRPLLPFAFVVHIHLLKYPLHFQQHFIGCLY